MLLSFGTCCYSFFFSFFFFNDTATTEIYTLSLHDALPISEFCVQALFQFLLSAALGNDRHALPGHDDAEDRKSTRLNSSHLGISYAVFCLKKKNTRGQLTQTTIVAPRSRSTASNSVRTGRQ